MTIPTSSSSSRFDAVPDSKYEKFFNSVNSGSLSDSESMLRNSRSYNLDEFIQFIREGILNTDPNVCKQALPLLMIMAHSEHRQDLYDRIRAVCRENGIKEPMIEPAGTAASSSSAKAVTLLEMLPGQTTTITPEICQIKCLEQTALQGGDETCGFHSLKNALIVMAITEGIPIEEVTQLFMDPQFYDNVETLACKERGEVTFGDASDAHIRLAWDAIVNGKAHPFKDVETPLNWNRQNLSIFRVGVNIQGEKSGLLTTDHTSIESLANLAELSKRKGPCHHTFIVGSEGHWVTIVYEKNEAEQVRWYGIDSLGDSQTYDHILEGIKSISDAMDDIDLITPRLYYRSVGEDIKRKVQGLNTEEAPQLIHPNQVDMVKSAAAFMDKIGWLKTPQEPLIEQFINDVRLLALNYQQHNINDPFLDKVLAREIPAVVSVPDLEIAKLEVRLPLTKNIQSALIELRKLPAEKSILVTKDIGNLYSKIGSLELDDKIGSYIEFIKLFPLSRMSIPPDVSLVDVDRTKALLKRVKTLVNTLKEGNAPNEVIEKLLTNCKGGFDKLIFYADIFLILTREIIIELESRVNYEEMSNEALAIIQKILSERKGARRALIESLQIRFDEILDPVKARRLAMEILFKSTMFSVPKGEDDPDVTVLVNELMERASQVEEKTREEALNTENNPYAVVKLHQIFQQAQSPEKRLVFIEGEPFYYNIGNEAQVFRRSDISPDLSGKLFVDLFQGMEERLKEDPGFNQYIADEKYDLEMDPEEKKRLEELEQLAQAMNPNYKPPVPPTFNQLKNNFLMDSYIQGLLQLPENSDEEVSADQYQLYAIIEHLQKQDSTRREGELLSPQEQMLLQYSRYIWFCPTGKKEGIRNVYRLIPETISIKEANQQEKLLEKWTHKFFVDQIERVIESEDFLKALLDKTSVADKLRNHQSDFLKYRFGKLVGLNPEIKLDFWTQSLFPEIHQVTEEKFLTTFYQFFDIASIVQKYPTELTDKFSKILIDSKSPQVAGALYQHLEKLMGNNIQEAISLDDDGFIESLTPKGKEVIRHYYEQALQSPLMILEKPNLKKMTAGEIISFILETGKKEIDLSQCTHLSPQEIEEIKANTEGITLEQLQKEYPTLVIMGAPFRKDGKGALEDLPPFQRSAAQIRAILDKLLKPGVIEGDAGLTLMYETGEETLNDLIKEGTELGLSCEERIHFRILEEQRTKGNPNRGWVLISNGTLTDSVFKSNEEQTIMLEDLGVEMPSLLELYGLALATYKLQNQKRIFIGEDPWAFAQTSDIVDYLHVAVGDFSRSGPRVGYQFFSFDPENPCGSALAVALRNV